MIFQTSINFKMAALGTKNAHCLNGFVIKDLTYLMRIVEYTEDKTVICITGNR